MSYTAVALLTSTAAYCGFQLTIRVLVYPQFARVSAADFAAYEADHQRRVSMVVGPLFAALVAATVAVAVAPPRRAADWIIAASALDLLVILGVTAGLAVPLHRRLAAGWDADTYRRLLAADTVRLIAAVLDTVLAGCLVLRW